MDPRRQRKAPGGGEASRGPSVPRCLGGRVGGNASSHYKAKGRRRAKVSAPPSPAPKGNATMKLGLAQGVSHIGGVPSAGVPSVLQEKAPLAAGLKFWESSKQKTATTS